MFNHPDSCRDHEPRHDDWVMACPGCIDDAKKKIAELEWVLFDLVGVNEGFGRIFCEFCSAKTKYTYQGHPLGIHEKDCKYVGEAEGLE